MAVSAPENSKVDCIGANDELPGFRGAIPTNGYFEGGSIGRFRGVDRGSARVVMSGFFLWVWFRVDDDKPSGKIGLVPLRG